MSRVNRAVRPPVCRSSASGGSAEYAAHQLLIVDLNNFANFPTLAVGILTAALRNRGHQVEVLCPLAYDVPAVERERPETHLDHVARRVHLSDWTPARSTRDLLRKLRIHRIERPHPRVIREVHVLSNEALKPFFCLLTFSIMKSLERSARSLRRKQYRYCSEDRCSIFQRLQSRGEVCLD